MRKTVLITGTSTGIGHAAALLFHKKGWNVAATVRTMEKPREFYKLDHLKCFTLDVTNPKSIKQAVSEVLNHFGAIDTLVNNAGVYLTGPLEAIPENKIRRIFEVNVQGTINVTKELIPHFRRQKKGTIINVSSVAGKVTFPFQSLYHGSKWAIEGFSQGLAHELKDFGVRVKTIAPGMVKTNFYDDIKTLPEYGNTVAYKKSFTLWHTYLMGNFAKGYGPEVSAKTVYKAATAGHGKSAYASGMDTKVVLLLKKIMPNCWFNSLIRKSVGI